MRLLIDRQFESPTAFHLAMSTSWAQLSRRKRRVEVLYDDDLRDRDVHSEVTVFQSATGRLSRSTTLVSEGTSDSAGPWTPGYFDGNTEPFVLDSLPDELQDFDTPALQLDPDEETRARPKVLDSVYRC